MDYYKIGQQIRKIRKARGLSQEALAELVNISTTHMSHIETANTKLSLQVLVDIAAVLEVRTDDLLNPDAVSVGELMGEISEVMDRCTADQAKVLTDIVKAAKLSMDKYL